MTSSNPAGIATPQSETSRPEIVPIEIYIVSYNAEEWSEGVSLLDGRKPLDRDWGSLGSYRSSSQAQDVGIEWALKQLQDRLQSHSQPDETEEERDAAFDEWEKTECTQGDSWSYTVSKDNERLLTKVHKITLYDAHRSKSTDE